MNTKREKTTAVLFPNKNRKTEAHPHYTGKLEHENGKDFYISAWINKSKSGGEYINITFGDEIKPLEKPLETPQPKKNDLPF